MSWPEIKKAVNGNLNKPLNEKLIDFSFPQIYVFEKTTNFNPPKDGLYKIICVGSAYQETANDKVGGAGGVAIKTMTLNSTTSYSISISSNATFNSTVVGGGAVSSSGGVATGGDFNFNGQNGKSLSTSTLSADGASVGVFLNGLSQKRSEFLYYVYTSSGTDYYHLSRTVNCGYGILNFGYGGGAVSRYTSTWQIPVRTSIGSAGVLIIPLDLDL